MPELLAFLVAPLLLVGLYFAYCVSSKGDGRAQGVASRIFSIVAWVLICSAALGCLFSFFSGAFRPATTDDKLRDIDDSIGATGILEYVRGRMTDDEIIEYLLDN